MSQTCFSTYLFYLKQLDTNFYLITSNYINMRLIIYNIFYFEVSLRRIWIF